MQPLFRILRNPREQSPTKREVLSLQGNAHTHKISYLPPQDCEHDCFKDDIEEYQPEHFKTYVPLETSPPIISTSVSFQPTEEQKKLAQKADTDPMHLIEIKRRTAAQELAAKSSVARAEARNKQEQDYQNRQPKHTKGRTDTTKPKNPAAARIFNPFACTPIPPQPEDMDLNDDL